MIQSIQMRLLLLLAVLLMAYSNQHEPLKDGVMLASRVEARAELKADTITRKNSSVEVVATNKTAHHNEQLKFDLYPVQKNKIILNMSCQENSRLQWDKEVVSRLKGLKKAAEVVAFTEDTLMPATLGELSCLIGECGGNYVGVDVVTSATSGKILAIGNKSEALGMDSVPLRQARANDMVCSEIYAAISHPSYAEVESERRCNVWVLADGQTVTIAKKGFDQGNDWNIYVVKGQLQSPNNANKGPVFDIDVDTSPLDPVLSLTNHSGAIFILWKKEAGICCPSSVTVQMSRLDGPQSLTFGKPSTAGGQPCD